MSDDNFFLNATLDIMQRNKDAMRPMLEGNGLKLESEGSRAMTVLGDLRAIVKDRTPPMWRYTDALLDIVEAVAPLVSEWRDQPITDDEVWRQRNAVVVAFDALKELHDQT